MPPEVRVDKVVVLAYLDEVAGELDAVKRLLAPPPTRYAVYHLQQAAEKLVKAVRLARGLPATKDHSLEILIEGLPSGEPWRARLEPLEWLPAYATTYRYPSPPRGTRQTGPAVDRISAGADSISSLLTDARREFSKLWNSNYPTPSERDGIGRQNAAQLGRLTTCQARVFARRSPPSSAGRHVSGVFAGRSPPHRRAKRDDGEFHAV